MYVNPKQKRRVLLSFFIIALAIPLGVIAMYGVTQIVSNAAQKADPKDVIISNVTSTSLTVTWLTDINADASLEYSPVPAAGQVSKSTTGVKKTDTRGATSRKTHFIEIEGLEPATQYQFTITSNGYKYTDEGGSQFKFKTAPFSDNAPVPNPVYGNIKGVNSDDSIVYALAKHASGKTYPLSAIIRTGGNWTLDLSGLKAISDYSAISVGSDTEVTILAQSESNKGAAYVEKFSNIFDSIGRMKDDVTIEVKSGTSIVALVPQEALIKTLIAVDPCAGKTCGCGSLPACCTPNCSGKQCGSNGCGGSCGSCASGKTCNSSFQCVATTCTPSCSGKVCGSDGCGGSCGTCTSGSSCNSAGQCVTACVPSCSDKSCGESDGCGGKCVVQSCETGKTCSSAGACVEDCSGKTCGCGSLPACAFVREFKITQDVSWGALVLGTSTINLPDIPLDESSVKITNLTDTGFNVVWISSQKEQGLVKLGTSASNLETDYNDMRDTTLSKGSYNVHNVEVTKLTPNTQYYYKIVSGANTYDNSGAAFGIKTFATLSTPPAYKTVSGKTENLVDPTESVVLIQLTDKDNTGTSGVSNYISTVPDSSGNWIASIGDARNVAGTSYFTTTDGDQLVGVLMAMAEPVSKTVTTKDIEDASVVLSVKKDGATTTTPGKVVPLSNYGIYKSLAEIGASSAALTQVSSGTVAGVSDSSSVDTGGSSVGVHSTQNGEVLGATTTPNTGVSPVAVLVIGGGVTIAALGTLVLTRKKASGVNKPGGKMADKF